MGLLLKILGILFLVIVIGLFVGFFLLKKFLKKAFKQALLGATAGTPSRITLEAVEEEEEEEEENEKVLESVNELEQLGFTKVGAFEIPQMPGVSLVALCSEQQRCYAVVYKHLFADTSWLDLFASSANEHELTVSNAPDAGNLDSRPEVIKHFLKDATIAELNERFNKEAQSLELDEVKAEEFVDKFCSSYAREMDWRNKRGGAPTREEFMRTLKDGDKELSEEQIEQAYSETVYSMGVTRLAGECIETFKENTTLSVKEWEEVEDRCFAVHEHIPQDHLKKFVEENFWSIADQHLGELDNLLDQQRVSKEIFEEFNNSLPATARAQKIGEVHQPVYAEIYSLSKDAEVPEGGG